MTAATVAYSGSRAYGLFAPYANFFDSRLAISLYIIITARDGIVHFVLRQVDLLGAKFGLAKQIVERFEYVIEIAFQARPRDRGRVHVVASFNFRSANFEVIVELIASLSFSSTGAPDFAVNIEQSGLTRRFGTRPAADARDTINDGKFMVFLQEDHHAIRQFDALGLLRMKCRQSRNGDLLPIAGLRRGSRKSRASENQDRKENARKLSFHCAPPF